MRLRKDIGLIGVTQLYYNLSIAPYIGNINRQHICFVAVTPSVNLAWTFVLFVFH
jgi:hypothetical protein